MKRRVRGKKRGEMRRVCEYEKERGGGEKMEGEELGGGL